MRHTGICICLSLFLTCLMANGRAVIPIRTQKDFDSILEKLCKELLSQPDEIVVDFESGTYYFDDRLLRLDNLAYPGTAIRFIGNNAIITGKGGLYHNGDRIEFPFDSGTGVVRDTSDVFLWSTVFQAEEKVRVHDSRTRECSIKCKAIRKSICPDITSCYLLISEWYRSKLLKVTRIEDGEIYFTADDDLNSLNDDFHYARLFPRFKLLNTKSSPCNVIDGRLILSSGIDSVYVCHGGRLLSAYNARFKSLSFEGFRFIGNRDNVFALMDFTETITEGISICDCEFCGLRSKIIQVAYTPDFTFKDNFVHNCYQTGVNIVLSSGAKIISNVFRNTGINMSNDFCIACTGNNYLIANNSISDFGYGGISVGLHFTSKKTCPLTGTVRDNELWYTQDYFNNYPEHTLMDSGAIYVSTQNDRCIIRNNYIHDYIGIHENRGIFLDDGASHVTVTGNTILRVPNSWSIDSRLAIEVITKPGSQVREANVGVTIYGNRTDGKIRFERRRRKIMDTFR